MFSPDIKLDQLCNELRLHNSQLEGLLREPAWIISFSGGADSVLSLFTLLVLHRSSLGSLGSPGSPGHTPDLHPEPPEPREARRLIVYYLDHGGRLPASEQKTKNSVFEHYQKMLSQLEPLETSWVLKKKNVPQIAKRSRSSFERTGSRLRQKGLRQLAMKTSGCIVLGHHLSDWYETLIMRMNRGSSLEKLLPFGFSETGFLIRRYYPLYLMQRNEIRSMLGRYGLPYWDDPTNEDETILRNLIRKKYPIRNRSGLRKTARLLLKEKKTLELDFPYEVISPMREIRIPLTPKFSPERSDMIGIQLKVLEYLGLGALSSAHRRMLKNGCLKYPPYYVEIENWGGQKYMVFRRGLSHLKELRLQVKDQLESFSRRNGRKSYFTKPASTLTKSHKIRFDFGRKSVKALLKEKSLSDRQKDHLDILFEKECPAQAEQPKAVFIPLSVFGLANVEMFPT